MNTPPQYDMIAVLVQVVGLLMVAGLLVPMTRAVPGQFLRYWALGWAAAAAAMCLEYAAQQNASGLHSTFLMGYCFGEYLFGFLVWAGCREFATGEGFTGRHAGLFLPFAACAVLLPLILGNYAAVYPLHTALMGGLCLFAFAATFRRGLRSAAPTIGLLAIRVALLGISALFFYRAGTNSAGLMLWGAQPDQYSEYLPLARTLFGTTLAFGMMVLASDRMREELETKNEQLEAAAAYLENASRTDALTGLLNRRAFDILARNPEGPGGCLAVLDLNDLKVVNDRHGHAAGDAALRIVARALANQFRVTDPLFRTGGDEFVVVLPGGDEADLTERLGCVDAALKGQRLPGHEDNVDLNLAWGVAKYATQAELVTAFQQADGAMYAAKRARKLSDSQRISQRQTIRG